MAYGCTDFKYESDKYSTFSEVIIEGPKASLYVREMSATAHTTSSFLIPYGIITTSSARKYDSGDILYIKKSGSKIFRPVSEANFKYEFFRYFEDCHILEKQIVEETLTAKDIEKLSNYIITANRLI